MVKQGQACFSKFPVHLLTETVQYKSGTLALTYIDVEGNSNENTVLDLVDE